MDPDGEYSRQLSDIVADQPPEPSAPPVDQECLLSATTTRAALSLDPPEDDMATLTVERGRSHHLEPPGVADRMIDHVPATCAVPGMSDANLPVASAVPIVAGAVGASTDTCVTNRAAFSSERDGSTAPNASTRRKTTNQKKASGNKPKEGSLAELRRRRQEREPPRTPRVQTPSSDGQHMYREANGRLLEPQPRTNERLSANPRREKPSLPDKPKSKESSTRRPVPSFFQEDYDDAEWGKWLV